MRCVRWYLILVACVFVFAGQGISAELQLPSYTAGTNSYSNVVISVSAKGRVLIQHPLGMASIPLRDLDLDQQAQLVSAGLIKGPVAKEIEQMVAKRDAVKLKAEQKAARGPIEAPALTLENAEKQSIFQLIGANLEAEADEADLEPSLDAFLERFGSKIVYGLSVLACVLSLLRKILFFRIHKNATGEGSFLIFLPLVRWFALARAADMSRHLLLIPMFAVAALFFPPDTVSKYPWAAVVWLVVLGLLWLSTGVLYLIWCVKLCRAVSCSGGLAALLVFPGLDYIALFILAFAGSKAESAPLSVRLKKPMLAI
jgi:hypothetical protein